MSSSPLYLAIVVVWLIVLVPMLMRRDVSDPDLASLRRTGTHAAEDAEYAEDGTEEAEDGPEEDEDGTGEETEADRAHVMHSGSGRADSTSRPVTPLRPHAGRARVIARRRRRTSGLTALLALTGAAVALGLGPWWVLVPPGLLLLGHLVLLREAAKADAERRAAELRLRRRTEIQARRRAAAAREAEVVELMSRRDQVYDQYTDAHLRAAGD